jgi:oxygen-independent coproporphyrinogen-3 oxidase
LAQMFAIAKAKFGGFVQVSDDVMRIARDGRPLTRMIAALFDTYAMSKAGHSSAV